MLNAYCASASPWPERPVRIVVPAPAGSSLDVVARTLAERLWPVWRQPVIVDNRPGAGGIIGVDAAAKSPPDGHTAALGFNGPLAYAPYLYAKLPYDAARDLAPVILTSSQPNVLAVTSELPARTVAELVAWARSRAGRASYASIGSGSSSHLAAALFARQAGFDAVHVPYQGSPAAALSVARGETQLLFAVASGVMPQVQSGQLRLLAVTSARRFEGLESLPTLAESGFPGFVAVAWNGIVVPAAVPAAIVARINGDVARILAAPELRTRFRSLGMTPGGGSSAAFGELVQDEMRRWGPVIRESGIRVE